MIKLTDRLQRIADEVEKGEIVCDIGTDHGFLPLYLWENKISPHVIMADVSRGSLDKARANCNLYYPEEKFDLRLGDGLAVLEKNEADTVVIAGMGGILMTEILKDNPEVAESINKFIFQPRSNTGYLRWWLLNNGYSIVKDSLVEEGKFICSVITAVHSQDMNLKGITGEYFNLQGDDIRFEIPGWLQSEELFREFLFKRIQTEETIQRKLKKASEKSNDRKERSDADLKYLTRLRDEIFGIHK